MYKIPPRVFVDIGQLIGVDSKPVAARHESGDYSGLLQHKCSEINNSKRVGINAETT